MRGPKKNFIGLFVALRFANPWSRFFLASCAQGTKVKHKGTKPQHFIKVNRRFDRETLQLLTATKHPMTPCHMCQLAPKHRHFANCKHRHFANCKARRSCTDLRSTTSFRCSARGDRRFSAKSLKPEVVVVSWQCLACAEQIQREECRALPCSLDSSAHLDRSCPG